MKLNLRDLFLQIGIVTIILGLGIFVYNLSNPVDKSSTTNSNHSTKKSAIIESSADDWGPNKSLFKKNRGNLVYAPMGDSLTEGFFATQDETRYVSVFADYLNEGLGYNVSVGGISGYGGISKNGVAGVDSIIKQAPDLVSLEYGTNDADQKRGISPATLAENLTTIIEDLNSSQKPPKIFLMTTWKNDSDGSYDKAIKKVADKYGYPVVDIRNIWEDPDNSGPAGKTTFKGKSDDFHPNDKGMELIAQKMYTDTYKYISGN